MEEEQERRRCRWIERYKEMREEKEREMDAAERDQENWSNGGRKGEKGKEMDEEKEREMEKQMVEEKEREIQGDGGRNIVGEVVMQRDGGGQ
ncbi:Uncharacterized protein DAT39_002535, partial [Clarias magur]